MPLSTSRPASRASSARGETPIPTTTKSQSTVRAAGGAHARDRAAALKRIHALAEQQLDAVLRVHVAIEARDLGAEDPLVGQLERVDRR